MNDRQIHITRQGTQYGPYPESRVKDMLAEGQLLPTDLAWYEGAADWKPLNEMLGPTPAAAQETPPPPPKPAVASKRQVMTRAKPQEEEGDPGLIHITRKGKAIGSYSREKAKEYFIGGTLLQTDWGWHDGMGEDWKPLNEVLGLLVEKPGSSKTNNLPLLPKRGRDPTTVLKEMRADRVKLYELLILTALDGILVGFCITNPDFVHGLSKDLSFWWVLGFLNWILASLTAMLMPEITPLVRLKKALSRWALKAVLWLPQKILKRTIKHQITAPSWYPTFNFERIQGDWKKPYALVTLVGLIAFFVSFMLFKGQEQDEPETSDETVEKMVSQY